MSGATHPISLASGVVPEFGAAATIGAAVAGGFDAVGLWVDPATWTDATTRDAATRLADAGMPLLDVEVIWIKPGPLDPDHLRILDIGGALGAANALVVSSDPDAGATAAKFAALCAHGRARGMRVALEFGMFTEVRTIDDALAVIAAAGDEGAALLIDPIHLARSGGSPEDVAAVPRRLLPYAQFCDAVAVGPDPRDFDAIIGEAVDGRLQTGAGALPLRAVLEALPAGLPLSIELRSKPLRDAYPDPDARALAVADATRRFLASLN